MKNSIRWFILLISIFVSLQALAKTVLVSDIDDTIKNSYVNSKVWRVAYALSTRSSFKGMSELYSQILLENENSKIYYLSNAPAILMKHQHMLFLQEGDYPEGDVLLRSSDSREEHKLNRLREIIEREQPTKMILIGDNGEKDISIYNQINREYAHTGVEFFQFIRIAYSRVDFPEVLKLKYNQVGFVTPVEIAIDLAEHGILSRKILNSLSVEMQEDIVQENLGLTELFTPRYFPWWFNCQDYSVEELKARIGQWLSGEFLIELSQRCGW